MLKKNSPELEKKDLILDHSGRPIPERNNWNKRFQSVSSKTKIVLISIVAIIAATASLLTNLETIQNYFSHKQQTASIVPAITVKLSNSSNHKVDVVARSDFFLWLPGAGARHYIGKYKFINPKNFELSEDIITIESGDTLTLFAKVINQDLYSKYLQKKEYDIQLHVRRANGSLTFTEILPFTIKDINKYYATVDVGKNK